MGKPLYLVVSDPAEGPLGRAAPVRLRRSSRNASPTRSRAAGERTARLGRRARRSSRPQRRDGLQRRGALAAERRHRMGRGVRGPERPRPERSTRSSTARAISTRRGVCSGAPARAWSRHRSRRSRRRRPWPRDSRHAWRSGSSTNRCSPGAAPCSSRPRRAASTPEARRGTRSTRIRLCAQLHPTAMRSSRRRSTSPAPQRQAASTSCSAGSRISTGRGRICRSRRASSRTLAKPRCGDEPISIYVPLDTIRDYLFVTDAARMVVGAVERREEARRRGDGRTTVTKIFASEVETTVASVLGTWRRVLRRPLRVALASDPIGSVQPRTLAFRSHVWPDLRGVPTPFLLGVDAVRRDQLARLLAAGLG